MWGLWLVGGSGGMVVVAGGDRVSGEFVGCFCFCLEEERQRKREKDADFNIKE